MVRAYSEAVIEEGGSVTNIVFESKRIRCVNDTLHVTLSSNEICEY